MEYAALPVTSASMSRNFGKRSSNSWSSRAEYVSSNTNPSHLKKKKKRLLNKDNKETSDGEKQYFWLLITYLG